MQEETKRALKGAVNSGYLHLAHAIIKRAARDAKAPLRKDQAFFASEGFLWLLLVIGCEPENLEDIAGRIAMQAFRP